jgi:CarboxypepD_reg-like domain/TonB-dependent Receptor Plug Domain
MKKYCFLILILLISFANAQTGTIKGFLYQKDNGEPVIFAPVQLKGTKMGAATDINGYFSITKVPAGNYTLFIKSLEYDTVSESISIKEGETVTKKYNLAKSSIQLAGVEITAEQTEKFTETKVSVQRIDPVQINKLPSVGQPDIAQYLQVIPGINFTGDQGGQLYIRGGSPVQNKVLLDGMVIYNPFHSIGLFSVFDNDAIKNADVYTAGFNAEYGGRVSAIMDVTTKDGNKKRLSGKIDASTFGSKILLEGPLKKAAGEEGVATTFLLSAKNSYLPQSSKILYKQVDGGLPFGYNDYYGKVAINTNNGSKMNLFGMYFSDNANFRDIAKYNWVNAGGGANFLAVPKGSNVIVEGVFAYSQYKVKLNNNSEGKKESLISGFNTGLKFTNFFGKDELNYGFDLLGFKTSLDFTNKFGTIFLEQFTTELASYVKYKKLLFKEKLILEPGLHIHFYPSLSETSVEPRFSFKYSAFKFLRFKGAAGLYSQNLLSTASERDVVNLFYGFVSGSNDLSTTFKQQDGSIKNINSLLQKSRHLVGGVEIDLFEHLDLNIEVFQKQFNQLTSVNPYKILPDEELYSDKNDSLKKTFIFETGDARGLDVSAKYEKKRFYFWGAYSLGFVKRWNGSQEYFTNFDRRHNVNLVGSYKLGKKKNFEVSARWNLASGFPFTQTLGNSPRISFNGNDPTTDYLTQNPQLTLEYSKEINKGRLPYFHRLDLTVKWKYGFSETTGIELSGGVTNAYDRKNLFYVDRETAKSLYQLPFLPNFNARFYF